MPISRFHPHPELLGPAAGDTYGFAEFHRNFGKGHSRRGHCSQLSIAIGCPFSANIIHGFPLLT